MDVFRELTPCDLPALSPIPPINLCNKMGGQGQLQMRNEEVESQCSDRVSGDESGPTDDMIHSSTSVSVTVVVISGGQ